MIKLIRILSVSLGAIATLSPFVQAQTIIPAADGTATLVMPNGNTFNITGGTLSGDGRNLFHSFQEFGLSTQQIANFIANPTIQNILGRVVGGNPSLINGLIQVSGGQANLFLMNPSGMVFGPNASINVPASFAATTATGIGFGNGQFNAYGANDYQSLLGNPQTFVFQGIQPGAIINAGDLAVTEGQGISLVAGTVVNTGNIVAPEGEITLAAVPGTSLVRISQVGQVISLEVPLPTDTQGNAVPFNATDLPSLLTGSGLDTGLTVTPQGTVQVTASGTQIPTTPGTNIVAGQLSTATDGAAGLGGTIQIAGTQVGLVGANLDASGTEGGGKILVGGEYQGQGDLPTAQNTYVSADSVIKANALNQGDGGEVIVWADGNTAFAGSIEAQGGSQGGDGGFVEVSGKENLAFQGQVNLQAPQGDLGTLLLDPENITITNSIGENDEQLPVILFDQDPGVDYTISQSALESLSGDNNIILQANNDITIEPLSGGILTFQPGTGSITFVADANSAGVGNFSMNTDNTILAPGRNVTIQGGNLTVGQIVTSNFGLGNSLESVGGSVNLSAIDTITTGSVETGGGNVNATGANLNLAEIDTSTGTEGFDGGAITLTATGNIQTGNLLSYTTANRFSEGREVASQGGDITLNAGGSIDTTVGTGVEVVQTSTETLFVPVIASGSETGNGGNITLNADGNIKTAFLGSGSLNNGIGGDINLTSTNGAIDATQTVTLNGESQILGAIATASRAGQGGKVTITAPGNVQTGTIITGNIDGSQSVGDVTINSTQGSINTALGANISPVSAELLAELGVDAQYLAEASQIGVDLGIFTVSKNVSGGNVTLTAENDITTSNIITGSLNGAGGNIELTSNNGSIDTSAAALFENLTASFLQSLGASENLAQLGAYLSDNQIGGLITFSVFGNGGNISLSAPGDITTNYLIANSYTQRGGNVSLNSDGNISIGGLLTNVNPLTFSVASDGLTVEEWTAIGDLLSQGSLTTAGANGGNISLLAAEGEIDTVTVNAQGGEDGVGGSVEIRAGGNVRVTGTFVDQNGVIASISNAGGAGGGNITIQAGNTPFIVGDASVNGTAGAITSGEFTILPNENFDFTTERGNIALILQDPPGPNPPGPNPPGPNPPGSPFVCGENCAQFNAAQSQSQSQLVPPPLYALTSQNLAVKTLAQAEDVLAEIEAKTGKKPALIYVNFTIPDITPPQFADAQFNQVESSLVSEYQTLITPKLTQALPSLAIPPKQDYQLELVVITQGADPYRIAVPQATRKDVLVATNRLLSLISQQQDGYLPFASELYQWLIAPIEPILEAREIDSTLFFLPDGLRTLPLAALYDESEQKFVVQKDFAVGTAPSLNLVDYRYRNLNQASVLAFGATEFPEQNQTPLPGVGIELPLVQSIKGGDVFLNQDFNLSNLANQRQVNPLPIVHLATHADFLEAAPRKSYIQLYNQKLELPKWNQLDLNLPATDLLVISACNTAVGNSAVELGFGGMAVQAGVKTSLASLWPVGDVGTVGLMDSFYRNLKTVPIKSEALQLAQRSLLSGEYHWVDNQLVTPHGAVEFPELDPQQVGNIDLSHPYFWSAFMMIGSPW